MMRILIAEDDATSRAMLQSLMARWGYEVVTAIDGLEALEAFRQDHGLQLAILDWEMPGLEGPALCRKLRDEKRQNFLYLILLTCRNDPQDLAQGLEAGANDYLAKPFNHVELQARIKVGKRLILLQNEMQEREKLQGVMEMAGAVCHELNQPLQAVSGYSEMLLMDMETSDPNYQTVQSILGGIQRIGELTAKIMKITRYQSKPYLTGNIVDIHQAADNTREK
ncbi:MAG: response regulator [Desulfobacteraceae bacterium]